MVDQIADKKIAILKTLSENQNALLATLKKVNADLFAYRPAVDRWSIAEIVEHIILVENGVLAGLKKAGMQPKQEAINKTISDEALSKMLGNRGRKIDAPAHFVPKGVFTDKATAIADFTAHRANLADFVHKTDLPLAYIGFPHFAAGMLNGFDWLVFMTGHCERHIMQMEEIIVQGRKV